MGGKGGGRIGRCELHAHEEGGEADKGSYRGAGIGAPGARHVGEHVVVRVLEGDAPLFVVADFLFPGGYTKVPTNTTRTPEVHAGSS